MKEVANGLNLPAPTKKNLEELFKKLDVDKNGVIDYEEFKVFAKDNMIKLINEM
jgi:Ca2+-binding EF-hand superfamily protein